VPISTTDFFELLTNRFVTKIDRDRIDSRELVEVGEEAVDELEDESLDEAERVELKEIVAIVSAIENEVSSDEWSDGVTFIPRRDWVEYARELAEDIGAFDVEKNSEWPLRHIDWESAAEELEQDYAEIEIGGSTYLFRQN
jgi:hypothetical protein